MSNEYRSGSSDSINNLQIVFAGYNIILNLKFKTKINAYHNNLFHRYNTKCIISGSKLSRREPEILKGEIILN